MAKHGKHEAKEKMTISEVRELMRTESWLVNEDRMVDLVHRAREEAREMFEGSEVLREGVADVVAHAATGAWDAERVKQEVEEYAFTVFCTALATVAYEGEYDLVYHQELRLEQRGE